MGRPGPDATNSSRRSRDGYLWMLWDKDNQTLHDKVVNSVVVKE